MSWKRKAADDKDALPALSHRAELLTALRDHGVAVVSGDTGCGKSTQVPQFLLDASPANRIVVTQPRRLAARALAERVASERGSTLGRTVGYAVSRDKATTLGTTRLTFMTVGLLLQLLIFKRDEVEAAFTHIVVDEAHERDVDLDLLLLLLKRRMKAQANKLRAARASAAAAADTAAEPPAAASGAEAGGEEAGGEEAGEEGAGEEGVGQPLKRPRLDPAAAASEGGAKRGAKGEAPADGLRLVVMSATIDASAFAEYYRGCSLAPPAADAASSASGASSLAPVVRIGSRAHQAPHLASALLRTAPPLGCTSVSPRRCASRGRGASSGRGARAHGSRRVASGGLLLARRPRRRDARGTPRRPPAQVASPPAQDVPQDASVGPHRRRQRLSSTTGRAEPAGQPPLPTPRRAPPRRRPATRRHARPSSTRPRT